MLYSDVRRTNDLESREEFLYYQTESGVDIGNVCCESVVLFILSQGHKVGDFGCQRGCQMIA
jgi:hypothetical protein